MGNPNTGHLVKLLDAEILATHKHYDTNQIKSLFDSSIAKANRAGLIHNAALANERAGDFFLKEGDLYWAEHYLGQSKSLYADWGAAAKVSQIERKFGFLVHGGISEYNLSVPIVGRSRRDVIDQVDSLRSGQNLISRRSLS
jgi:hypothetical protein